MNNYMNILVHTYQLPLLLVSPREKPLATSEATGVSVDWIVGG